MRAITCHIIAPIISICRLATHKIVCSSTEWSTWQLPGVQTPKPSGALEGIQLRKTAVVIQGFLKQHASEYQLEIKVLTPLHLTEAKCLSFGNHTFRIGSAPEQNGTFDMATHF